MSLDNDGNGLDDAESNAFSTNIAIAHLTDALIAVEERVVRTLA